MVGVSKIIPQNQKQVLKNIYLSFFYGAKIGIVVVAAASINHDGGGGVLAECGGTGQGDSGYWVDGHHHG